MRRERASFLSRAFRLLAAVGTLGVVLVLAVDVASRELLGIGFDGARELAMLAMIAWVAAGIALAAEERSELRLRVLDGLFPPAWNEALGRLGDVLAAFGYLALAGGFIGLGIESLALGEGSPVLRLPPALAMGLLALAFLRCAALRLRFALDPRRRPPPSPPLEGPRGP